jgi:hypothetical protein
MQTLYIIGNSHTWTLLGWHEKNSSGRTIASFDSKLGDIMRVVTSGFDVKAAILTETTAYNLMHDEKPPVKKIILNFLDKEIDDKKTILFLYGEVDCTLGRPGISMKNIMDNYEEFIKMIDGRPDVERIVVSATIPHHDKFESCYFNANQIATNSAEWNDLASKMCLANNWTYIDIATNFDGRTMGDNHMHPDNKAGMMLELHRVLDSI